LVPTGSDACAQRYSASRYWRQLIEATPWGQKSRHPLHDRDAVYGHDFRRRARRIGIDAIATPVRSPRANQASEARANVRPQSRDGLWVDWQFED
jgi:hypothetical protein